MGTIISVDSVVYNMAGPEEDRPNYLKSLIFRHVLSDTKAGVGETLNNGYMNGPGMRLRAFYRWAKKPEHYGEVGMPTGELELRGSLNEDDVTAQIPTAPGEVVWVQQAELANGDPDYWVERWFLENNPAAVSDEWEAEYSEETGMITVTYEDTTTDSFAAPDFDYNLPYIYVYYRTVVEEAPGPLVVGDVVEVEELPDTTDWTLLSEATTPFSGDLSTVTTVHTHVLKEYSDGRPDEETEDTDGPDTVLTPYTYHQFEKIYQRRIDHEPVNEGDPLTYTIETMVQNQDATIVTDVTETPVVDVVVTDEGGVTVTTTTTTTTTVETQSLDYDRSYRVDMQLNTFREFGPLKLYIYQIGSGNPALDALVSNAAYGEFFPFMPVRINNKFLSEEYLPDAYAQVKKAYKRALGGKKIEDLVEQLEDNENLEDIDHAYIVFGVSLNVLENSCKKYLYTFFEGLQATQIGGAAGYDAWAADIEEERIKANIWLMWKDAYYHHEDIKPPEPERPSYMGLPLNQIRIKGTGELNSKYDMRLEWAFVSNGSGTGLGKPGAKNDELWLEYTGVDELAYLHWEIQQRVVTGSSEKHYHKFRIYWQRDEDSYTWLEVLGAIHRNYVYGGKAVKITVKQALEDPDESGFIVPLHYDTWRNMSIVDTTQMATACVFIVFNCYVKRKTRWYESWIFKILLVIVIAIASVVFTGGAGFGLLGSHFALGVSLGFSGMTAAIVGSIANALAALVLTTMIETLATELFGPLGAIISTVLMIVVGNVAGAFNNTGAIAMNWGNLLRVDNLLRLTDALGRGITGMIQADTMRLQDKWEDYSKNAARESEKIQQAYLEEFGYGGAVIDPMMFVDANNTRTIETSDAFLTRTLLTGSEIADMSQDLLYNFSEYSLTLPNAFT
jgi:hypothetical protein